MKYLFDTHAFLWSVFNPEKLSVSAKNIFKQTENPLALSVVTFWEISLKYEMGKLTLTNCKPDDLVKIADKLAFDLLELTPAQASTFHQLPRKAHEDPFDRIIAWQAIQEKMTLISKDEELDCYQEQGLIRFW